MISVDHLKWSDGKPMIAITFEHIKLLVEMMPPTEQDRLRQWLENSPHTQPSPPPSSPLTWGQQLVGLVEQFPLEEDNSTDRPDPEEWVREHRRTQTPRRNPGWGE
jgi:hypothetical protein